MESQNGALSYEKQGRIFVYTPLVGEKEYIEQESSSFLKRFYHGDLTAMVSSFLEEERLSDQELEELRLLLSQKKGEH